MLTHMLSQSTPVSHSFTRHVFWLISKNESILFDSSLNVEIKFACRISAMSPFSQMCPTLNLHFCLQQVVIYFQKCRLQFLRSFALLVLLIYCNKGNIKTVTPFRVSTLSSHKMCVFLIPKKLNDIAKVTTSFSHQDSISGYK